MIHLKRAIDDIMCPVILKETRLEFTKMHIWELQTRFFQNDKDTLFLQ